MNPPPKGWPRIAAAVYYDDAGAAIDWLVDVFGFEVRTRIEGAGGRIEYSEVEFGGGLVMVSSTQARAERDGKATCASPRSIQGVNTMRLCVCVDDVEAHHAHAEANGARIAMPPTTDDYGEDYWCDRSYEAVDLEGHHWWFMQRLRG